MTIKSLIAMTHFFRISLGNKKVTGTLIENKHTCECNDHPFQEMKQFVIVY